MDSKVKIRTLVIGTIIGAAVGAGAAYLMLEHAEELQDAPKMTANQGIQVGLGLLGLLKLISGFGKG